MNIVCIGAHPDDAEFYAGGAMILWSRLGHRVTAVSLTNGDAGHQSDPPALLAGRRAEEAREAARRGGYQAITMDAHDGELMPTLEMRREVVRLIRRLEADVVLTHRACDYHPDHRYTAVLVQDAAFMVTVPHVCPDTPALRSNPVFLYMMDAFAGTTPFRADLAVAVDAVLDEKWALLDAMPSQFYEWLPWLEGRLDEVSPTGDGAARLKWLAEFYGPVLAEMSGALRDALPRIHRGKADSIHWAEYFEICPFGRRPSEAELSLLCISDT
ncbi:MAG: PIG-L family deacetylase [Candidatus Hydrogenedens sp.]|nr:PIG-L family deacetylase [Candidatus Hydrogenedentota bacterium]NLF56179.1 PIG-L family deacetylase [Candidatus Hydrogenedens sp.]